MNGSNALPKSRGQNFRLQIKKNVVFIIFRIQRLEDSVDLDEVAHYEPSDQDLRYLQTQLFLSLVLLEV